MLHTSIIVAIVVYFIHACTWKGMVFQFVRNTCEKLPAYLKKPLFDCPTCMSVWWGPSIIAILILYCGYSFPGIVQVLLISALAGGINAIIEVTTGAILKKCDCGRAERIGKYLKESQ